MLFARAIFVHLYECFLLREKVQHHHEKEKINMKRIDTASTCHHLELKISY